MVELRAQRAAQTSESYFSPLPGMTETVPAPFRVWQFLLWVPSAGAIAMA